MLEWNDVRNAAHRMEVEQLKGAGGVVNVNGRLPRALLDDPSERFGRHWPRNNGRRDSAKARWPPMPAAGIHGRR